MKPDEIVVPGVMYAGLFDPAAAPGPDIAVNYAVWNRIYHGVPDGYRLPDLPVATLRLPGTG